MLDQGGSQSHRAMLARIKGDFAELEKLVPLKLSTWLSPGHSSYLRTMPWAGCAIAVTDTLNAKKA